MGASVTPDRQPSDNENESKKSGNTTLIRAITGLAVTPIAVIVILWGGWVFAVPLIILASIATLEYFFMEQHKGQYNNAYLGLAATIAIMVSFQIREPRLWQFSLLAFTLLTFIFEYLQTRDLKSCLHRVMHSVFGVLYIAFPLAFFIAIRQVEPFGIHWAFSVIFSTWTNDTMAYAFGRAFGKHKLAPRISPNKTVEGALGGIVLGTIMPMLVLWRVDELSVAVIIMLIIASFAAVAGDLFESALKRYFTIKDSHLKGLNVLPGHGGVLDRIDALLWVLVVHYIFLVLVGKITLLI